MSKTAVLIYGVFCYLVFFGTVIYMMGFIGNIGAPHALDGERQGSLAWALVIDFGLIAVFGLQHSVMARPAFKKQWAKIVPHAAERSTYVLFSCLALILLFRQWRPTGGFIWNVEHPIGQAALYAVYGLGWVIVFATTFLINHFDLFGLRHVWLHFQGKPYTSLGFVTPGPYKHIRHPLYVGWLTVFWATPTMTVAHLVFALGLTAYILIAIRYEERDLETFHGHDYKTYRKRVPMLIPRFAKRSRTAEVAADSSAA